MAPFWFMACAPGSFLAVDSGRLDTDQVVDETPPDEERPEDEAPTCGPVVEVATPEVLEGETVVFSVDCSEADRSAYEASLSLPDGASWDEASWSFSWTTGLGDADPYDLVVSVRHTDWPSTVPESAVASFWVADDFLHPDNELVDPASYTHEWGVPVLHLLPAAQVTESYTPATAVFEGRSYTMEAKYRGASSLEYPKKSYTLKFADDDQLELSDHGFGDKKHVALITTFDDNSYVRQKLIYDTWYAMAEGRDEFGLALRSLFVVVYLSGEYHGLYVMTDKVDDELMQQQGFDHDANLYKSVNHDANFYRTNYYGNSKSTLHDGYEKKEGTPEEGQPGAFDDLDELVAFAADSDADTFAAQAEQWFPVDAWMDWLLLVHVTNSSDSGGKNVYLYNDPTQTRWYPHPWDFNHSFGQNWYTLRLGPESFDDFIWTNGIFWRFQTQPDLAAELNARLHASMAAGGPLATDTLLGRMDAYYEHMGSAAERDWSLWGQAYRSEWWASYREDDWTTFEEERAYLEQWIVDREDWMLFYDLGG